MAFNDVNQAVIQAVIVDAPDPRPDQGTQRLALFVQDPDGGDPVPFFEAITSDIGQAGSSANAAEADVQALQAVVTDLTTRLEALEAAATEPPA